jgi:hypothetical protein
MTEVEIVEIGFSGGQGIAVRLSDANLKALRKALDKPDGWFDLETEGGTVALDLSQVVFVRTDSPTHSVGFSG